MARVEADFDAVLKSLRPRVAGAIETVAKASEEHMAESISINFPPASLAGYPPHLRTGYLKSRCYAVPYEATTKKVTWRVGNDAEYALPLELGSSKLAARPFIKPTLYGFTMAEGKKLFEAEMSI